MVLFGADRVAEYAHLFIGRTALLTGPSGRTSSNEPTFDALKRCCDLRLLLAPEHGGRGDKPAGAVFADEVDEDTGLTVRSLYTKESKRLSSDTLALFDTLAALLAALVIIPAMAAGGADLSDGGPGLMFIFLVNVFNGMPGGRVIGLVFFLCVLFAGLTSLVNLYEVSVEALQDKLHLKRVAAVAVIAVIGTAVSLCIQAIVSDWMDVVSIYICPLGALLAGILFFWVAGKDFVLAAVNKGADKSIGAWFYPLSKYVYCACALLALIAGALLGGIG